MVRKIQAKLVLAFACPGFVGACDREVARHVAPERFRCARCGEGRRRRLGMMSPARPTARCTPCCFPVGVSAKACTSSPTGPGFIASWARVGRDVEDPARRIRGRMPTDRETPYGLRPVLASCTPHTCRSLGVTSRVEHKAGRTIEVDWAGKTLRIVDPVTGDSSTAYLFVAVLPFSRYAFVEPTLDMAQNSWLRAHVAMYEWFGGSTPRLVCDNLKTGVIAHPREGEVVLNDAYRGLAEHYSAAVLPGRVRKPKDKPSAENTRMARHDGVGRRDARPTSSARWTSCGPRYARGSWNTIPARSRSVTDHVCRCSKARRSRC